MARPPISGQPQTIFLSSAVCIYKGVNLGLVSGVKVKIQEQTTEAKSDQFGKAIVNHFYVGNQIDIEMMFDEFTAARMKQAFPQAAFIESGGAARIQWGKQIGDDYYSDAGVLEIFASNDDVAFAGRRFTFHKVAPQGDAEIEYGPDKQIRIKSKFFCYPDLTSVNGYYGYLGDLAAGTLVAASAGSPVAGGGNVGNGTVTGIFVSDQYTKTEVWTLECIAAIPNGGIFSVSGSVTGAMGNATVGSAYVSRNLTPATSEIGFLINDGATDFADGDTFTIATTAANYT
jgi:hypothetical protein